MMRYSCRFGTSPRAMIAAAAVAPWLAACAPSDDPNVLVGSSQPTSIVSSTTADYGDYGVSVPGTDWGRVDAFGTQCLGGCRTLAGGS